ncbi:Os01g0903900, partial [Oryza sativa Japonica Group]
SVLWTGQAGFVVIGAALPDCDRCSGTAPVPGTTGGREVEGLEERVGLHVGGATVGAEGGGGSLARRRDEAARVGVGGGGAARAG